MKKNHKNFTYCPPVSEEIAFVAQSVIAASPVEEIATIESYTKTDLFE